jgi:hypothetical protein
METAGWTQLTKYNFETWEYINPNVSSTIAVTLKLSITKKILFHDHS